MRTMLRPQGNHLREAGAATKGVGAHSFEVSIGVVVLNRYRGSRVRNRYLDLETAIV